MGLFSAIGKIVGKVTTTAKSVVNKVISGPKGGGLANIVAVGKSIIQGKGTTANTGSKLINKGLEKLATRTGIIATPAIIAGGALGAKTAIAKLKSSGVAGKILGKAKSITAPKMAKPTTALGKGVVEMQDRGVLGMEANQQIQTIKQQTGALGDGSISAIQNNSQNPPRARSTTRRSTSRRRKSSKRSRRSLRRRSKKRFGTAKQYARKGGKTVYYTKNGQPYIKLKNGQARFVKGRRRK